MESSAPAEPLCEHDLVECLKVASKSEQELFETIVTTGVRVAELRDATRGDARAR